MKIVLIYDVKCGIQKNLLKHFYFYIDFEDFPLYKNVSSTLMAVEFELTKNLSKNFFKIKKLQKFKIENLYE